MPLPTDVGEAIAAYLRDGRPRCCSRRVFIRVKAPLGGFASSVAICFIVMQAAKSRREVETQRRTGRRPSTRRQSALQPAAVVLAGRRRTLGSEHSVTMASAADLALAYHAQGKFAESEPLARARPWSSIERSSRMTGNDSAPKACWAPTWLDRRNTAKWIVQLYRSWGQPEKLRSGKNSETRAGALITWWKIPRCCQRESQIIS